jgi:two-component system NtrC family sensor kinase
VRKEKELQLLCPFHIPESDSALNLVTKNIPHNYLLTTECEIMINLRRNKALVYLSDIYEEKKNATWLLNISIVLVVILCISIVGLISFRTISESILKNVQVTSNQLVKQTTRNIETILENLDDLAFSISKDSELQELIFQINSEKDEHKKAEYIRRVKDILNKHVANRSDIADIVVVTNTMEYINNGLLSNKTSLDVSSMYIVKQSMKDDNKSLWVDTYTSDSNLTYTVAGEYGQVISLVKKIYVPNNLESQGMLIINYKESSLYNLISDIKVPYGGKIYVLGKNGNYVLNQYARALNNYISQYELFIEESNEKNSGSFRRKIDGEDHILTFYSIQEIKGTYLGWKVVLLTPEASIMGAITKAGKKIFYHGLGIVAFGFALSILLVKKYRFSVDRKYNEEHSRIIEQERLASLGQFIGGIAYNFKTPIMSISEGLEVLKELVGKYENAIDNPSVTEIEHHKLAAEMREGVKKIRPHCSYMSDIISAVKGQAVNCNESSMEVFTIKDMIKRVDILMSHELKKHQCNMNVDFKIDELTEINGEINNIVQVLNNLISNSIESYNGNPGKIDIVIYKKLNNVEIEVRDYGCGIPEKVKNKLLKEMITTKGEKGTGIGLYISYSTVKGKFGGNMSIESEEGKGTCVKVSIPIQSK